MEHQRGGAAGRQHGCLHPLARIADDTPERLYFPGHGGQVEEPQRLVKAYLLHRRMREHAILDCIRQGHNTATAIVPVVYRGLDPKLLNAATLSVLAHVEHLQERGLVAYEAPLSVDRVLSAVSS